MSRANVADLLEMDVIYPVRPGDDNEELRYSLRSIAANFPHRRVWIVGYKPFWVTGCEYIPGNTGEYHANVYNNIRAAVEHPDVSDRVVIFNDDFFVTEPVAELPTYYRGTLAAHIAMPRVQRNRGWWLESLQTTMLCLQAHAIAAPLSYELHVPLMVDRACMAATLAQFRHVSPANPPQWRTLYCNMNRVDGEPRCDVKAYGKATSLHKPFHSTEDRFFPSFVNSLHELFTQPCRYELPGFVASGALALATASAR
ncbi:MAG: hypothetical protein CK431_04405 [Mycobacterium sp.]|nr:MAG: hypothetical protein CK431_04405 [Mycobacterium sp.]